MRCRARRREYPIRHLEGPVEWALLVLLIVAPHFIGAQMPRTTVDSTRCLGCVSPRSFHRAAAELMTFELIPYGYNRWIANDSIAQTTLQTWSDNLRRGWEWDNDHFPVNQLAHPYSGNL